MDLLRYNLTLFFTSSCPRRLPELVNTVLFYRNLSLPLSQAPSRARAVSQRARAQQSALPGPSRRLPAPGLPSAAMRTLRSKANNYPTHRTMWCSTSATAWPSAPLRV